MHLDEPLDDGKADAEPTLRAIGRALALHEQVEHSRQELGRDSDAVVAHGHLEVGARVAHGDDDLAASWVNFTEFWSTFVTVCTRRVRSPLT